MDKENTQKVVRFLLKKRDTYGDKFRVSGFAFKDIGFSPSEAKDVLVHLDKENIIVVLIPNSVFDLESSSSWIRYSEKPDYELKEEPIIIQISKKQLGKISKFDLSKEEEGPTAKPEISRKSPTNGRLALHLNSGDVVYHSPSGNTYTGSFGVKTNAFLLIRRLAQEPTNVFEAEELVKAFNEQRNEGSSTPDRRIRDTIQSVRKMLKTVKEDDPFIIERGYFGLNCEVAIKS